MFEMLLDTLNALQDENTKKVYEPIFGFKFVKVEPEELFGKEFADYLSDSKRVLPSKPTKKPFVQPAGLPVVDRVIYNKPATIVFWKDGTKTMVKCCADDVYDKEKGFALCFIKKLYGNSGSYNKLLRGWCDDEH